MGNYMLHRDGQLSLEQMLLPVMQLKAQFHFFPWAVSTCSLNVVCGNEGALEEVIESLKVKIREQEEQLANKQEPPKCLICMVGVSRHSWLSWYILSQQIIFWQKLFVLVKNYFVKLLCFLGNISQTNDVGAVLARSLWGMLAQNPGQFYCIFAKKSTLAYYERTRERLKVDLHWAKANVFL